MQINLERNYNIVKKNLKFQKNVYVDKKVIQLA